MIREYDANDYDLESGAGVYLSNIAFYTGVNHLVCAMKKLEG